VLAQLFTGRMNENVRSPKPSLAVQVVAAVARMLPPHGGAKWHQERETREAAETRLIAFY